MAVAAAALTAYGAIRNGQAQKAALDNNAMVMGQEKKTANEQGASQEAIVRRNSRESLGRQVAAFGSAGIGYGGTSHTALDSSSINQEMDALNTRYRAQLSGYGYGVQSGIDKKEGNETAQNSELMAGAALLKGLGPYYSSTPTS